MNDIAITDVARATIDQYLDRVERELLRTNATRQERLTIIEDLEAQIFAMASERQVEEINESVAREIVGGLDEPTRYAQSFAAASDQDSRPILPAFSGWAIAGRVLGLLPIVFYLLLMVLMQGNTSDSLAGPLILLFYASVPVAVIGTVWCGVLSLRSIERSPARIQGRWAAILCCLAYPMILANVALYLCVVVTFPISVYLLVATATVGLNIWLFFKLKQALESLIQLQRARRSTETSRNGALQLN